MVRAAKAVLNRSLEGGVRPETRLELVRLNVKGKFLFSGERKLWVKGVSYGTFEPDANGNEFHDRKKVEADLKWKI